MKNNWRIVYGSIFVLTLAALTIIAAKLPVKISPRSTKTNVASPTPTPYVSQISLVWGRVTNTKGQPLSNMIVFLGSNGVKTDPNGQFSVISSNPLGGSIYFIDEATDDRYQIAHSFEQSLFLSPGESLHQDFVVEKVNAAQK